jgi:acetyl-CoA carboxylase carboxyl transferase subunit beta
MADNAAAERHRSLTLEEFESDATLDDMLDLSCPGCGADLLSDPLYDSHRVCGNCKRHFPMRPRERIALLADANSFVEMNQVLLSIDPVRFGNSGQGDGGGSDALAEAVVTGVATFGGREAVVVAMDDSLIGSMLGAVTGEKTIAAFELAHQRRIPCVLVISGGTARVDPGALALVQHNRLAATFARLHVAGVPVIGIVTHPTSASMFQTLASHCDLLVAEPGARVGGWGTPAASAAEPTSPEDLIDVGLLDSVVSRVALRGFLSRLMGLITATGGAPRVAPTATEELALPSSREALAAAQRESRPTARDVAASIASLWIPVRGDRLERDDDAVIGGIASIRNTSIVVIALDRKAGMPTLSSVRKATRLARLAGHLDLPLLILVDAPAAVLRQPTPFPVGQGAAQLASVLSLLPVPVISVVVGVAAGPLGLAALQADRVLMQTNAVMCNTMIETPPAHFGRRRGPEEFGVVAPGHECLRLGIADGVIDEPRPAADVDPESANQAVERAVIAAIGDVSASGQRRLLDRRELRLRTLGQSTAAGRAEASHEIIDLQDWQRSLTETIDDWRERWEQHRPAATRKTIQRPDLGELAGRLRARRSELLERTGIGERLASLEEELRTRQGGRDQETPTS